MKNLDQDAILPSLSVGVAAGLIYGCFTLPFVAAKFEAVVLTTIITAFATLRVHRYVQILRLRALRDRDREFWAR